MKNVEQTIISQYANSPTLTALIRNMNEYIDPRRNIDDFYSYVMNLDTAQGFGLDIWGRIVNLSREVLGNPVYYLSDDDYRSLLFLKALSNISLRTAPAINQLLQNWIGIEGVCYVTDSGSMAITYVFEFSLTAVQISILQNSGIFLRPAGVKTNIIATEFPVFGFSEMGAPWVTPFNGAPFVQEIL